MRSEDKLWIKWIIFAIIVGALVGKCISVVLGLFLSETWALLINMVIPATIILGLVSVLYLYQRQKENTL